MTLTSGSRLGSYEIAAPIGAGGMGEVYRAKDTKLGRDVAIKILPAALAQDPERLARFEREARVLASLNHPNIAHVYGFESAILADGMTATFLAMEMVEGEDLAERLKRGAIPVDESITIAKQIAEGLVEAHEKGVVHRDLKPANIKVTPDGKVKILDFGLAKAYESDRGAGAAESRISQSPTMSRHMTEAGMIMGTAAYMSPEQARGKAVDKRADIWAFGVVLYEMLTGRRLFSGETVSDVLAAVLMKEPDLEALPARFRRLLGRCLEKDPQKRLRDIGDGWFLLEAGVATAEEARSPKPRAPWLIPVGAALIGALAMWGAVTLWETTAGGKPDSAATPLVFSELPPQGTSMRRAPSLSPDGRRLALIAMDQGGQSRIWVRELGEASPRPLDGSEGATLLFWSPDSAQLAFATNGQVRRADAGGGPVSLVVAAEPSSGVWLKDGTLLLAIRGQGLVRVPAAGGSLRPSEGFPTADFQHLDLFDLSVSSDERWLLYRQFGGKTGVYGAPLNRGPGRLLYPGDQSPAAFVGSDLIVRLERNVLVAQRFKPADLSFVGDAFPIAQNVGGSFSGGVGGSLSYLTGGEMSRLQWFRRDGKMENEAGPPGVYQEVVISRHGRFLGFVRRDLANWNTDIWLQPLSGGAPNRLTSDPDTDHLFTISPDERFVAWEAHVNGTLNLARRPVDGSAPARIVRTWGKSGSTVDWLPDGKRILYVTQDGAGTRLWVVSAEEESGEPVPIMVPGTPTGEGRFSPDGHWLAFAATATGEDEIYVQPFDGNTLVGGAVRVSEGGGHWPLWRGDGRELFFINRGLLMSVDFSGRLDGPVGEPKRLFKIPNSAESHLQNSRSYAVTPDGQRFLAIVSATDAAPRPATVILNWVAGLAPEEAR